MYRRYGPTKRSGPAVELAIGKTIVQSYGGTLVYSENPAGGAIFTVELPAERAQVQEQDTATA